MRERLSIVLALALSLCLAGCGRAQSNQPELIRTQSATNRRTSSPASPPLRAPGRRAQGGHRRVGCRRRGCLASPPTHHPGLAGCRADRRSTGYPHRRPPQSGDPEAVPEEPTQTPAAAAEPALNERLFLVTCAPCHLPHGRGVEGLYRP